MKNIFFRKAVYMLINMTSDENIAKLTRRIDSSYDFVYRKMLDFKDEGLVEEHYDVQSAGRHFNLTEKGEKLKNELNQIYTLIDTQ